MNTANNYYPDTWVILELTNKITQEKHHRILAGWYGGYAQGDSWQINSGITKIKKYKNYFEVYGFSGSIYKCHKQSEKLSNYTASVYTSLTEATQDLDIQITPIKNILTQYK